MRKGETTKNIVHINRDIIKDKIKEMLADRLGLDVDDIKNSFLLKDDLGIDSFDSLRIIFEVENAFNIKVPPTEVLGIKTVNDIINYILKRLSETNK